MEGLPLLLSPISTSVAMATATSHPYLSWSGPGGSQGGSITRLMAAVPGAARGFLPLLGIAAAASRIREKRNKAEMWQAQGQALGFLWHLALREGQ